MTRDPALRRRALDRASDAHLAVDAQRRPTFRAWGRVTAVAAGGTTAVAALGEDVYDRAPGALDTGASAWALAHRTPGALTVFEWISRLGEPASVTALTLVVAIWLWRIRARYAAIAAALAPLLAVVVFNVVKLVVHRTRPTGRLLLRQVTFSFPSGHATVSTAVFGILAWVLAREGRIPRGIAVLLAVVPPLLIGFSRVYLNVHWATDVLAGWCLGAAVAAVAIGFYEWERLRRM